MKRRPKDNRDRLFRKGRPDIRPAEEADLKWVFLSKKLDGEEVTDELRDRMQQSIAGYQEVLIFEDSNSQFKTGHGPVGMAAAITNGYLYEPHIEWFHWATRKNKLRGVVAFLQKLRYRDFGVVRVHSLKKNFEFFRRMRDYVPLYGVGKVPAGDALARGDDYIFYMKCRGANVRNL